jgi:recombination protein RecT
LIPRRNNRRGTVECKFELGYKGILALVYRSGQILSIDAVIVYARDRYEIQKGTRRTIRHEPYRPTDEEDSPGNPIAYYAVAALRGGGTKFEDMWKQDVERHRDRFAAARGEGTPWDTHFDAMALKTVLKRLCKYLPVSVETATAVALDDAGEAGLPQNLGWLTDVQNPLSGEDAPLEDAAEDAPPPSDGSSKLDAAVANRRGGVERGRGLDPEEAPARRDPEAGA